MGVVCAMAAEAAGQDTAAPFVSRKFSFSARPSADATPVTPTDVYPGAQGFGIDLWSKVERGGREDAPCLMGQDGRPWFFSMKVPPGAYKVTVTLGDPVAETVATVKSETRRLMLESVRVPARQTKTLSFLAHVRVPTIPGATGNAATVALKPREREPILYIWDGPERQTFLELDWDEKLTLEFLGPHAAVQGVEIETAPPHTTVYLIGDSTMTDQMMEPWAAWGQQFPRWFKEPVLIANYAESGETTASFIGERRWAKVMSEIQAGDYVLMQFGINDRAIPLERFKQYFVQFIADTRAKGATPVLVTSQNLRRLDPNGKGVQTLGGYPDAMKEVAAEQKVTLIDLNAMSATLYEAIGPTDLPKAFVDGTHHSAYGSYELAKCVVKGVLDAKLPFGEHVVEDWKGFDPAKPDPLAAFNMPPDPQLDPARPGGPGLPNGQGAMAAPARAATGPGRGSRGAASQPGR
jgi:lysophospholipase L1-like esterase